MRSLQWDIFCKVIDNFGDVGFCWRLAADLTARGQRVRLWLDDSRALAWMAPGGCEGVHVLPWTDFLDTACLESTPCDVLIEAFGCEVAPEFIAFCVDKDLLTAPKNHQKPLWINLEYLSAEPYVARNHGLMSLVSSGPAAGWQKVFFYPGFTPNTAGLLREPDLQRRHAAFDRAAWLQQHRIDWQGETLVSMFCYEPPALQTLLSDLVKNGIHGQAVRLLVAAGRATEAVKAIKIAKPPEKSHQIGLATSEYLGSKLSISYLPPLSQTDFDHLLWVSDINFVRGEDSIVRAIWAGKPFVWQIYPQDDGAHGAKLEAFLDMLAAPPSLRTFHRVWNGLASQVAGEALPALPNPNDKQLNDWAQTAAFNRARLAAQLDLTTGLIEYAAKNR
jgi:uncharacterized repeat protein (TIGR03837 family)